MIDQIRENLSPIIFDPKTEVFCLSDKFRVKKEKFEIRSNFYKKKSRYSHFHQGHQDFILTQSRIRFESKITKNLFNR